MASIYNGLCNSFKKIKLDASYKGVEKVPGLKTTLFPHQRTVVQAMIELELHKFFKTDRITTKYTAAILSEPVGSGKTVELLSLILCQKRPKMRPNMISDNSVLVFVKYTKILRATLIIVGLNVLNQWVNAVETFTNLKKFVVRNIRDLQILINMMYDRSINMYDLVIVKNGMVTRFPKMPDLNIKIKQKTSYHIPTVLSYMVEYCWMRVIIDDFDVIHLTNKFGGIPGAFTWFVSSTKRYGWTDQLNPPVKTTADALLWESQSHISISSDTLRVQNKLSFIEETNNLPSVNFYAYSLENPNDNYVNLINLFGSEQASQISEMLNNDSMNTAAESLGIKTTDVSSIFQHMLGTQYSNYKTSKSMLKFIAVEQSKEGDRKSMTDNPTKSDTYTKKNLRAHRQIKYKYPGVNDIVLEGKEEYSKMKHESGIAIERVKSNIADGECPVCTTELEDEDEDVFIIKCCGVAVCGSCCVGTIMNQRRPACIKCRKPVNIKKDLIYLSEDFDLTKIVSESMDYTEESSEATEEAKVNEKRTKISVMLEIINGTATPERETIDVNLGNLMKGTKSMPSPEKKKVLIFASYDEGLVNIAYAIKQKKIKYWRLMGTPTAIDNMCKEYQAYEDNCVLLINSIKYCAGLNLQCSSDLIFAHLIYDKETETQVMGRGQRLGRTSSLNVHYLLYHNEYQTLVQHNRIRLVH